VIDAIAVVGLMAVLNRFRGGGFGADRLPGHPRFYVAPMVAVVAWIVMPWQQAIAAGVAYLAWCWPPWGHLMCLGHWSPGRPVSEFEAWCLKSMRGDYFGALLLRHAVGLIPAMCLVSPLAIVAAPLVAALYAAGWRWRPQNPIEPAELLTGALWGAFFVWRW
jgi:hypothetical protein